MSKRAPLTPDDPRHGTTAGFRAHAAQGERPCRPCRDAKNAYDRANRAKRRPQQDFADGGYDPDDGLPAGMWMRDTWGVRVFVEIPPPAEPKPKPQPRKPNLALLIACPKCGAKASQSCRTSGGHPAKAHRDRILPQKCPCGSPPRPSSTMCEPCRIETRRATWRAAAETYRNKRREVAA